MVLYDPGAHKNFYRSGWNMWAWQSRRFRPHGPASNTGTKQLNHWKHLPRQGRTLHALWCLFFLVSLWRLWWWWIQQLLDLRPVENKPWEKSGPQSPGLLRNFSSLHCRYRYTAVVFWLLLEKACLHYHGSLFQSNIKLIINLPVILLGAHQGVHQD